MPSEVLLEGKVLVCFSIPVANKQSSNDGANVVVVERRWVVLKNEKLKVYDKKMNINRKKLFSVALTPEVKSKGGVYVENTDTREIICVFRFRQVIHFTQWSTICKSVFQPVTISRTARSESNPPSIPTQSAPPFERPPPRPEKPAHLFTMHKNRNNNNNNDNSTSNANLRHTVAVSAPSVSTSYYASVAPIEIKPVIHAPPLDLSKTDDVELLKKEILNLRRKAAILQEERDSLQAILSVEKDFVRDRQNKLDSWEHFARIIVFKALCNSSKNEMLKTTLNKIIATNIPSTKSIKISRMEVVLVNLPTEFEESPNFGLTTLNEETGIATFNFKWYPQNCNITLQIDGQKKLGGAIPINFKVAIDLLSKLKIKGELLISKGEGNQFLISLSRLPELTFASPSKLQIGDILRRFSTQGSGICRI